MNRFKYNPLKNKKGIALIMAMSALMLILFLAMEVTYDSSVEYVVNSQHLNQIKAYYSARSGMELSLLRIKIFQKVQQSFGKQMGSQAAMLDEIWKFPFAWPLPAPESMNAVDKDTFAGAAKKSNMDTTFLATIDDEGSKIDLNDLNSPSKKLSEITQKQIYNILERKWTSDEEFAKLYDKKSLEQVVTNIADWGSSKPDSINGGDKKSIYRNYEGTFPPNRAFRTLEELRMVAGMTDELFELIEPSVTVYGMKGINPNLANKEVLTSMDPGMTPEIVSEVMKRREDPKQGGPFKDKNDFWGFVQGQGARLSDDAAKIPLVFESVFNFKIRSTGTFGNSTREIIAIVMDLNKTASQVKKYMDAEKKELQQQQGAQNPSGQSAGTNPAQNPANPSGSNSISKGPPRIVYWNER